LGNYIDRRSARAGFGTIGKHGTLFKMFKLLRQNRAIIFVFDQHAGGRDGVVVDFLGSPAATFKSLAVIAMNSGTPVLPGSCWREPDGTHVLRFENELPLVEGENLEDTIKKNTQNFNDALGQMLLRHPDQWIWMHRRWKIRK
jgi:KDO2-lipid IV(A) lauroyltransferase